jgi:hypothetical protein
MRAPVAATDLVPDQCVARGDVGNAQQGLGQAHQRHAFRAGEGELLHQRLHPSAAVLGAQGRDETTGQIRGRAVLLRRHGSRLDQGGKAPFLGAPVGRRDGGTQRRPGEQRASDILERSPTGLGKGGGAHGCIGPDGAFPA